jgi:hypothetical protein
MVHDQSIFIPYSEYQRLRACEVRIVEMEKEKAHHEARHGQSGSGHSGAVGLEGGGDGAGQIQGLSDVIQRGQPGTLNVVSRPPAINPLTYGMVFPEDNDRNEQEAKREKTDGKEPSSLPNAKPFDTGERITGHKEMSAAALSPWYFREIDSFSSDDEDDLSNL